MTALIVHQSHDVEEERLYVIVQRFVVQEEFCQETQVLAVLFVTLPVHFPHANLVFAIYLRGIEVCTTALRAVVITVKKKEKCSRNKKTFLFSYIIEFTKEFSYVTELHTSLMCSLAINNRTRKTA